MGLTLASPGSPPLALGTHHPPLEEAQRHHGGWAGQKKLELLGASLTLASIHTAETCCCEGYIARLKLEMWLLVIPFSPLVITPLPSYSVKETGT